MIPYDAAYIFDDFYIPERMYRAIRLYIDHGIDPGYFLAAVIGNDLAEACCRADEENLKNLPAFVAYFYNRGPIMCWGSKQRMEAWIEEHEAARAARKERTDAPV